MKITIKGQIENSISIFLSILNEKNIEFYIPEDIEYEVNGEIYKFEGYGSEYYLDKVAFKFLKENYNIDRNDNFNFPFPNRNANKKIITTLKKGFLKRKVLVEKY